MQRASSTKLGISVVLFVSLMDVVGMGIIMPLFPYYAMQYGVEIDIVTFCAALYTFGLFVSTPLMGTLSDSIGRKPVMAMSLVGIFFAYMMLAYADSIWVVALSRLLGGLMAGNFGAAQAYIVDSTVPDERAKYMGYYGAAIGLGFIAGPALGSWLGGDNFSETDFRTPIFAAACLTLLALFFLVFMVKESLPRAGRSPEIGFTDLKLNIFSSRNALRSIVGSPMLLRVMVCGALYHVTAGFHETIFPLWTAHMSLIDGPRGLVPILLASGVSYIFVQIVCITPLTRRFSHRQLLCYSAVVLVVANCFFVIAGENGSVVGVMLVSATIAACAGVIATSSQTLLSFCATESERGKLLGAFSALSTLGRTISTVLSGPMYLYVNHHSPFYAAVGISLLLLWIASKLEA